MPRPLVVALAAAAFALAGCGGDETSSSSAGSGSGDATPTKAAYIAGADGICRDTQKTIDPIEADLDALPKDGAGRGEPAQIAPILDRTLAAARAGFERLTALPAPVEDSATLDRWLASTEESFAALEELQDAVAANDRAQAEAPARKVDALSGEQRTLARRYGFKACLSAASTD
ncbi:MAG: hypothetical protein ACRDMZ_06455 [Solirubrobacteraceae bacterium]